MAVEVNFDGLVGPTHNYAGLSHGNFAALANQGMAASPREAALQGVAKMRTLVALGIPQGVLPPHERPYIPGLRRLGFLGSDAEVLQAAWKASPVLTAVMSSASAMWTANAATVSPAADCADGRAHLTPANLAAMAHRSLEPETTGRILGAVLPDRSRFAVHWHTPSNPAFGDEGAANHNRMAAAHGAPGLEIFVYGREGFGGEYAGAAPARQTLEASQAVARLHGLAGDRTLYVLQGAGAIEAGAFHNDVVCVTNETVMMFHEAAFADLEGTKDALRRAAEPLGFEPAFLMAATEDMPLSDAIRSYVFNSQVVTLPGGGMTMIAPVDAEETASARRFIEACVAGDNPVESVRYLDMRQSMRNGGGPACLRLRAQMEEDALSGVHAPALMDASRLDALEAWVKRHYRDSLSPDELGEPQLLIESWTALDELTGLLELGSIYEFQGAASR